MGEAGSAKRSLQAPKGTRDFYPAEMLVRRYLTDAWRRVSLRHGFEEIDGPTFETAELYRVKSGEGILNEMFGVYSGKDPSDVEAVKEGRPPLGLRPEFTPTLARMYAARAAQLPKPTKWFCVSNFFRAERPQRGRLREFWQWNSDVLGGEGGTADAEVIAGIVDCLRELGLGEGDLRIVLSSRTALERFAVTNGVAQADLDSFYALVDARSKMDASVFYDKLKALGVDRTVFESVVLDQPGRAPSPGTSAGASHFDNNIDSVLGPLSQMGLAPWIRFDLSLARGLAYYTGTVFEVIAEGERAVAGGGRYDNLIELFGGPPTPACGFGMGDVVLANLLTDKKLMPEGRELLEAVSRPMPVRPDVFVFAANDEAQAHVTPLVAGLRRGHESGAYRDGLASDDPAKRIRPWDEARRYDVRPLHARRSYKATKNVGKLLADAGACFARHAVIVESAEACTVKNLDSREERKGVALELVGRMIAGS